ncbi:MAG: hypothetical protein MJY60_07130, partial [Bacteroidales bacterium]|nr:hypothetical protein [Bacteroidales bacterium]
NCSAKNGGGIAVWKNATLDENVLIKGCTATDNGGGVFVTYNASNTSYGQLTIQGNAKIEDCSAAYGGGIYTDNISVIAVTMTGNASVINCLAKASGDVTGGAVYSNAKFTANGNVLFSGNDVQSANSGAIIAADGSYGNVTISGGTFVSNSSSNSFAKAGSCSITLDGGYFNKAVDGATVKSGYVFGANPNTSAEDKAAYALGCIYKVVAP